MTGGSALGSILAQQAGPSSRPTSVRWPNPGSPRPCSRSRSIGWTGWPFVIYYTQPEPDGSYHIYSLLVDAHYQGGGFGAAALRQVIERLRRLPHCTTISPEYEQANKRAVRVYRRLGFRAVAKSPTGGLITHSRLIRNPCRWLYFAMRPLLLNSELGSHRLRSPTRS
jgi:ribosomal protein S18 acetylase RimI-like enzyme